MNLDRMNFYKLLFKAVAGARRSDSGESVGEWREVVALCKGIQDSLRFWDSIPWLRIPR